MKPSRRRSGDSRIALMAGMIVTWLQKTEKFLTPSAAACNTVSAVGGAVVSKPIAMNTICLSGARRASLRASSGVCERVLKRRLDHTRQHADADAHTRHRATGRAAPGRFDDAVTETKFVHACLRRVSIDRQWHRHLDPHTRFDPQRAQKSAIRSNVKIRLMNEELGQRSTGLLLYGELQRLLDTVEIKVTRDSIISASLRNRGRAEGYVRVQPRL